MPSLVEHSRWFRRHGAPGVGTKGMGAATAVRLSLLEVRVGEKPVDRHGLEALARMKHDHGARAAPGGLRRGGRRVSRADHRERGQSNEHAAEHGSDHGIVSLASALVSESPPVVARNLQKSFGELVAVDGIEFSVQPGETFGFLGPNGAGKTSTMRMIGAVSPRGGGRAQDLRPRSGDRRPADPPAARGRPAGGQPRPRADGVREPPRLRTVLRDRLARCPPARRASCSSSCSSTDRRERPRRASLGRHEAPADDRPRAHQRPRPDAARRAHDRARSAGAPRALGPSLPPEEPGRDARAHDALHGRGRAAV